MRPRGVTPVSRQCLYTRAAARRGTYTVIHRIDELPPHRDRGGRGPGFLESEARVRTTSGRAWREMMPGAAVFDHRNRRDTGAAVQEAGAGGCWPMGRKLGSASRSGGWMGYFQPNARVVLQQETWDFNSDLDGQCRTELTIDRVRQGSACSSSAIWRLEARSVRFCGSADTRQCRRLPLTWNDSARRGDRRALLWVRVRSERTFGSISSAALPE
jgi:hypothetical protein